jgi:hypothetical protein
VQQRVRTAMQDENKQCVEDTRKVTAVLSTAAVHMVKGARRDASGWHVVGVLARQRLVDY